MRNKANIWIYILAIYVVIQLFWWGVHLIQLTHEISGQADAVNRRVMMIIGEGCVFFVILLLGLLKIRSSLQKERRINEQQKNFLLSITHELKTPLASTKLNVQTIQKRTLSEDQRNMLLDNIQSDTSRLAVLINNILQVTQLDQRNYQLSISKFNLIEVVDKLIQRHQLVFSNAIITSVLPKELFIEADIDAMDTIIGNLIHNACKYGNESPQVFVSVTSNSECITISVEDNGAGIPIEKREDVFKRFVRLGNEETRSVPGTGIGLYLVKHFTELQDGSVTIKESSMGGAKFEIELKR
jgi:signal transduction histidine kinase